MPSPTLIVLEESILVYVCIIEIWYHLLGFRLVWFSYNISIDFHLCSYIQTVLLKDDDD